MSYRIHKNSAPSLRERKGGAVFVTIGYGDHNAFAFFGSIGMVTVSALLLCGEVAQVPKRAEFDELKQDIKVIKSAVIDLSHQVANHERRVSRLNVA